MLKHMVKWKFMDFTWKNEAGTVPNNHFSLFPKNEQSKKHGIIMCNPKNLETSVIIIVIIFLYFSLYSCIKEYKISSLVLDLAVGALLSPTSSCLISFLCVLSATCMSEVFWMTYWDFVSCACPSRYNDFKTKGCSLLSGRQ